MDFIRDHARLWPVYISRAMDVVAAYGRRVRRAEALEADLLATLDGGAGSRASAHQEPAPGSEDIPAPPPVVGGHVCPDCGAAFGTARGRLAHVARLHGFRKPGRRYAVDGVCMACLKDFHVWPRLLVHLHPSRC